MTSFQTELRALAKQDPKPYPDILELYRQHVPRVAQHDGKLIDITLDAMRHLAPCAVLNVLITTPKVPDDFIEYVFWMYALASADIELLAGIMHQLAIKRYVVYDVIVTKMGTMEKVEEDFPEIFNHLKESAEN